MQDPAPPKISKCLLCDYKKVRYCGIQRDGAGKPCHFTFNCERPRTESPPYCGTAFSVSLKQK